jgi:hypothetical protein
VPTPKQSPPSHLPITQASLVSALTFIVGQLVAFVPAFGPDKQLLISAGSSVIAAVFLVANAIHHLAASNVSAKDVEQGAINAARSELSKVNFDQLIQDAVSGKLPDVPALVHDEVGKLLKDMFAQHPAAIEPAPEPAPAKK